MPVSQDRNGDYASRKNEYAENERALVIGDNLSAHLPSQQHTKDEQAPSDESLVPHPGDMRAHQLLSLLQYFVRTIVLATALRSSILSHIWK